MNAEVFTRHRGLLFTVAYEILGTASDAEDVLQEAWLRWSKVDVGGLRDARAYLIRIVTRQALNRLRSVARRREDYVGEWLPEPLLTAPDLARDVELAESLSIAMLTVLETLGATERVVFVLREVFDTPYEEIAETLGKSVASVRQIAHRARGHVAARRRRAPVSIAEQERVIEGFLVALRAGDLRGLLDVLAPDVVVIPDGGGVVRAARRPLQGATLIAGLLMRAVEGGAFEASTLWINGAPAVRLVVAGVTTVASLRIEIGRIRAVYAVLNPQKLSAVGQINSISRA